VCVHTCRGNHRSAWVAEGGYDFVAEAVFNKLNVDGFFLEYDDARSGTFEPLRFVPKNKRVVLGLVTSKKGRSKTRTISSAGLTRRQNTSTSGSYRCRPSAALLRRCWVIC
jgi:5-methyltetrahydropteroyltriglutamate--homocysteine methyltransferase